MKMPTTAVKGLPLDNRGEQTWQRALEFAFGLPFEQILEIAEERRACGRNDLLHMGRKIYWDMVRLARGEISGIEVPRRLPFPGEFSPV